MFAQKTASLVASAVTSSISIVDWAMTLCRLTLEVARLLDVIMAYDEIDLPMSGLLPPVCIRVR